MGKYISTWHQGSINNEEEKYYGLAQGNILDGFLYRTLRRNWLYITGGDIVTQTDSAGPKTKQSKINSFTFKSILPALTPHIR